MTSVDFGRLGFNRRLWKLDSSNKENTKSRFPTVERKISTRNSPPPWKSEESCHGRLSTNRRIHLNTLLPHHLPFVHTLMGPQNTPVAYVAPNKVQVPRAKYASQPRCACTKTYVTRIIYFPCTVQSAARPSRSSAKVVPIPRGATSPS